jgi:uncharacterized membrane protein
MPKKPRPAARHQEAPQFRPAWEVVGLAAAGAAIGIYLGITKLTQRTPLLCAAGGDCEIVQASHYAVFLGVPTALWGAALYVVLGVLAARPLTRRRWLWAFGLAAGGVAFSLYLTAVSLYVLRAACGWCLASALIMVAILGALLWRRPPPGPRWLWLQPARLAVLSALVAVATVGSSHVFFNLTGPASPYQQALARHLTDTGARFYGAYWCPACREQKRLFGTAGEDLPYVECDAAGAGGRPDLCSQAGVRVFPTWVIGGSRHEGVLTLDTLARLSQFTAPGVASK